MANRSFQQFFNTLHKQPVLLDCNFVVDSSNGNGLGIRSLKGPGIAAVYMHTSATPAAGNPNPPAGTILVYFQDNYNRYFGGFSGFVSPVTSSSTSTTANTPSVITTLGTATLAQWQAVGLPVGITPAVGVAFIATASALIGGSGAVSISTTDGADVDHIEVLGNANLTINPAPVGNSQNIGQAGYIVLTCFEEGTQANPANGSVVSLAFYLSNSSVVVQGE